MSSAYTLDGTNYTTWANAAVAITTGSPGPSSVPDNGSSFAGLGVAMAGLQLLRRRLPAALKR